MKFILIMTIFSGVNSGESVSISTAEFDSKSACISAGGGWADNAKPMARRANFSYVCAEKGALK